MMIKLIHLLLFMALIQCSPYQTGGATSSKIVDDGELGLDANNEGSSGDFSSTFTTEPFEASAFINPTVNFIDAEVFPGAMVPSLEIVYGSAEYIQIMRCVASYEMESMLGQSVHEMGNTLSELKDKQTMWYTALRNSKSCKYISTSTSSSTFQDYTAPTGSYYYVINPCLTSESSVTKQDDCSYRLDFTAVFSYEEQVRAELHEDAITLSEIEQEIQAHMNNAYILSTVLEKKVRACENTIALETATKKQLGGLLEAAIYGTTFAVGFLTLGKDIGMAAMAAELATMFAGMELKKVFDLGEIPNTCLDAGKYTAYDTLTGMKTEKAQLKAARYEAMYGIVETYNELEKILMDSDLIYPSDQPDGDGGLLKLALDRYKDTLSTMAANNNDVLTLEQMQQNQ